jgi:hypothetical protein
MHTRILVQGSNNLEAPCFIDERRWCSKFRSGDSGHPGTSRSGTKALEQAKLLGAIVASCFLSPLVYSLGCSRLMRIWCHRNHCNTDGLGLWLVPIYTVRGERVRVNWSQNPNKLDDSYDVQFGAFSYEEDHCVLDFFASLMSLLPQDDVICGKRIKKEERDVGLVSDSQIS